MSKVIILNGCSSSGKSTLAAAIQQLSAEPFQYISLDQFRDGLPMAMRGLNAPADSPGAQGLNVVPQMTADGPRTLIQFGAHGDQVLLAMRHSVAACADLGLNVVVDDLFFKRDYVEHYQQLLDPASAWLVGVHCDSDELAQREQQRLGRFPGTAVAHLEQVHAHGFQYDVEVDTTQTPALDNARKILERLATAPVALTSR